MVVLAGAAMAVSLSAPAHAHWTGDGAPDHYTSMASCANDFYGHRVDVWAPELLQNTWEGIRIDHTNGHQTTLGGTVYWTAGVRWQDYDGVSKIYWAPWLRNTGGGSPATTGTLWERQLADGSWTWVNGTYNPYNPGAGDMGSAGAGIPLADHGSYEVWTVIYWSATGQFHYEYLGSCS
jgi:hypothetical protein